MNAARAPRVDWAVHGLFALSLIALPVSRAATTAAWALLAALLLWRLARGEARMPAEAWAGIAACLGTRALSIVGSASPGLTVSGWLGWAGLMLPVLAIATRRDSGPLPAGLQAAWIALTLALGAWLLGELETGRHILLTRLPLFTYPSMNNTSEAAQYSLLVFAWAFAFALGTRGRARILWTAAWVISVGMLAASNARATWFGFATVVVFSCWRTKRPITGLAAVALFVACNWVFPRSLWDRAVLLGKPEDISILFRLKGWRVALSMIASRPFSGVGYAAWPAAYEALRPRDFPTPMHHAHNLYLMLVSETGFLGLAGFGALVAGFRRIWREGFAGAEPCPEELALTALLLGFAVTGLFDNVLAAERAYAFFALAAFSLKRRASLTPSNAEG